MAQLNDLLVMGQSTLLGPISGTALNFDNSIQLDVGHSNEANFIPSNTNEKILYLNYRGGIDTIRLCNGTNAGLGNLITQKIETTELVGAYDFSTVDIGVGQPLASGRLYFVYEE